MEFISVDVRFFLGVFYTLGASVECASRCPRFVTAFVVEKSSNLWQKAEDQKPELQMSCITEHPRFQSNCLDVWVTIARTIIRHTSMFTINQGHPTSKLSQKPFNDMSMLLIMYKDFINRYFYHLRRSRSVRISS